MNIIKRDGAGTRPKYVNSFRAYAGNGEVILELSRVDLAATLEASVGESEPKEMVLDIAGRFIFRQDQIAQLINTLVGAISPQNKEQGK